MHHFTTAELQTLLEQTINLYHEYTGYTDDEDQAKASAVLETMQNIDALRLCKVCGLPLDPQDATNHMGHEDNCPHYGQEMTGDNGCDCEIYYHPNCCPECNDSRGLSEADGLMDLALEPDMGDDIGLDNYDYAGSDFAYDVARENGRL